MPTKPKHLVALINTDAGFCDSFRSALNSHGHDVIGFANAQDFLANFDSKKVFALVIDINLPGMNGLELQEVLLARKTDIPVIILAGKGAVTEAIQALKNGALNVLVKPLDTQVLKEQLQEAFQLHSTWQKVEQERQDLTVRLESLTAREREVFRVMAEGVKNQDIARRLGISRKTLDIHRNRLMDKLKARGFADLARWRYLEESGPGGVFRMKPSGYRP
jgi:FixJ family two-component response regulator